MPTMFNQNSYSNFRLLIRSKCNKPGMIPVLIGNLIFLTFFIIRFHSNHLHSSRFSGNNNINQYLKNNLVNYINNEDKEIKYDLIINSSIIKKITSKNKKGNPEIFYTKVQINVDIIENNQIKNKTIFEEGFEYKNKSSKFELNKYEENIQKNLTNELSKDLIEYLYNIK